MKKKPTKSKKKNDNADNKIKNYSKKIINMNPSYSKYNNIYKEFNIKKFNTNMQSKTERDYMTSNYLNDEDNYYSFEVGNGEEEEEEFNSDENISSTMLDVETNTYIDQNDKKSSFTNSQIITNKNENISQNNKKYKKAIRIKNKAALNQIKGCDIIEDAKSIKELNDKKNNYNNSFCPKLNKSNTKKKESNNKKSESKNKYGSIEESVSEKKLESKKKKKLENKHSCKENENKIYLIGRYNSPINSLNNKDFPLRLDVNSNSEYFIKKNNGENDNNQTKNINTKIKTEINNYNNNLNTRYKPFIYHKRSPTTAVNNSINKTTNKIKELLKQQYKKIKNSKLKRVSLISPKNQKFIINSMKYLNSINTINRIDTPKSSFVNNIKRPNRIIYYNANHGLSKKNNTIIIKKNNYINDTINLNNIYQANRIIFSPLKKELSKINNRNSTPTYSYYHPLNSNSISIDNINNLNKNRTTNKTSDKSITNQKFLSRNKTFKKKRHINNKNKFLSLLLNKNRIKSICVKSVNNLKINSKSKSPRRNTEKINNLKKIKNNFIQIRNQNLIGLNTIKNDNNIKNSYINSSSNRNQQKQFNNKQNLGQRDKKSFTKNFIYIKKENISNIVRPKNKNPLNPLEKKKNNLTISKSNKRYIRGSLGALGDNYKDKEINVNLTSVNLIKNEIKNKKIKLEIGSKQKNKYRNKTLLEEDYLRDMLINNINKKEKKKYEKKILTNKQHKKNKSSNKDNKSINTHLKTFSPSLSKNIIIKNPPDKHDINFNININMNNNDFKKLFCYYDGQTNGNRQNNSSTKNFNNSKKNESHSLNNKNKKYSKSDNPLSIGKVFYKKRNSNIESNGDLTLNKNKNIDIFNHLNYSNNYINIRNEFYHLNNNDMENIPNSFNNNYYEEYYDNISSIINKNRENRNLYKSADVKNNFNTNQTISENANNIKEENNKVMNNIHINNDNIFVKSNIEKGKYKYGRGKSKINIKLTNNFRK